MRFIIYGAGAVGGVIGAKLFLQGYDVVLIARGEHLRAIRRSGLAYKTPLERHTLTIQAVGQPSEVRFTSEDVIVLTMKTQDTRAALLDLRAAAGHLDLPVVCAQNGVENERMASRLFARTYAMLVLLPATHLEPGVVVANAAPISGVLDAGCYPDGADETIARVTAAIDASGFSATPVADVMRWKHAKLLSNLGNAVQAACGSRNDGARLYERARDEALACYRRAGIAWASDDEMRERRTSMSRMAPVESAGRAGGSTWQSLARGQGTTETDYLNGEIALLGRLHGVATPVNSALQRVSARMAGAGMAPGSVAPGEIDALIERAAAASARAASAETS